VPIRESPCGVGSSAHKAPAAMAVNSQANFLEDTSPLAIIAGHQGRFEECRFGLRT